MAEMNVDDLLERVRYLRELLRSLGVQLKAGEGLERALEEADAFAKGEALPGDPSPAILHAIAHDVHVIWALVDSLRVCERAGLPLTSHLKQLTTGTVDYGTPAAGNEASRIYFKDFEFELCIAAAMIKKGVPTRLADPPNDPLGDLVVGTVRVEVKHPNSVGQLKKLAGKFQKHLAECGSYGVFAVGLEDAFSLADQPADSSFEDFNTWLERKRNEMEAFGRQFIESLAGHDRILATVQTSSMVERYDGATQLRRLGNSLIYDEGRTPPEAAAQDAFKVASAFNPTPRRFSEIRAR